MKPRSLPPPPDHADRQRIERELDTTLLVEAAAGTGKTTSMVGRMVALLRKGKCQGEHLVAVTFTRKSAAELRARFQVALERAASEATGPDAQRLGAALEQVERCTIGTIHSFCARLLRERPIEAGVDLGFRELDEIEDRDLREQAWESYVTKLFADGDPLLGQLEELDLEIGLLKSAFLIYCEYPDVNEWPAPEVPLTGLDDARQRLIQYAGDMEPLVPTFPVNRGRDKLMNAYERVVRLVRLSDLSRPADLMRVLTEFKRCEVVQKHWPGGGVQAKKEQECWERFAKDHAEPHVNQWLEHRYPTVLRAIQPAVSFYKQLRDEAGGLNFQDLLMRAADLLRGEPTIRRYFRRRFSHLLIDEFQDTDPIQAQVMLYLTASDPKERDWRKCRPVPGSLFVVGDPKQSIYRFRRADIVTYNDVKAIIQASGGDVIPLTANFRTVRELVEWGNDLFDGTFPRPGQSDYDERRIYSPEPRRMHVGRTDDIPANLKGLYTLRVPGDSKNKDVAVEYEAELVARTIRFALDTRATVPRPSRSGELPTSTAAQPGDFLIVTFKKRHLALYAQRLSELGIPHQVTGGSALGQVSELGLLANCLTAVSEPENAVALLAVLRGELFGISDSVLYAFRKAGGTFNFRADVPDALPAEIAQAFKDAFRRLQTYAQWLRQLPPVVALERMAEDLGLPMRAAAQQGGNVAAGSLAKALEMLRQAQTETPSTADLARRLQELIAENREFDGLPARADEVPAVRLMNLHKVKGLEAPVVFLSDPTGDSDHDVSLHIDRSGDNVHGYLQIFGPKSGFHSPRLARPQGWEALATVEEKFQAAERLRLMYVAATRAGSQLVIVQRTKNNNQNYWRFFEDHQQGWLELPDPGPQKPPAAAAIAVSTADVTSGVEASLTRWNLSTERTYLSAAAKKLSLAQSPRHFHAATSEHGTAWGTVIHLLLETAMNSPTADLRAIAIAELQELELDPSDADMALTVVERVLKSGIWKRAQAASRRLVEVPFTKMLPAGSKWSEAGLPTVVRGVIDLVFREAAGWVIVDYKTDRAAATHLSALVEHYRPQVEMYAELWQEMIGEPVAEPGLYFTEADEYKTL